MNLILQAAQFAANAHAGVKRKYSDRPFIVHPMRVAGSLSLIPGVNEQIVAAGWLHDVVEDCPAQRTIFYATFGKHEQLTRLVNNLTNHSLAEEHKNKGRDERKQIDREFLATCDVWTKIIKLTDRLDNLRDLTEAERGYRRMYCNESVLLAEALKPDVLYATGPGMDPRMVEQYRLYQEVMAEAQKFF